MNRTFWMFLWLVVGAIVIAEGQATGAKVSVSPEIIYVDPAWGSDSNSGTEARPVKSISAAITLLPDPVTQNVTIRLAPGNYTTTGGQGMASNRLELMKRMRPGVVVQLVHAKNAKTNSVVLAWEGGTSMVDVVEGHWRLEDLQIGSGSTHQRRGVHVSGPGHLDLKNVTFRTRSQSDAGIHVDRSGKVSLYGNIRMNEHLHEKGGDETFCGIVAEDHGLVRFEEREGASLDIGNGSLSASYYGCIRLGCETAKITSWGDQSNNLAINNSGRIDLHGTQVTLRAKKKGNTPIGLEYDGHILGEGAHVIIEGSNNMAIALQKASTFTCNDIELRGQFDRAVWATSGSMFVGRFLTDMGRVEAITGANINIEQIKGKFIGPAEASHCGRISLPDRDVLPKTE